MRLAIAWIVLLLYLALCAYYVMGSFVGAAFSVAVTEPMQAVSHGRAMLALGLGGMLAVLGIILFLVIKEPERRGD